MIDKNYWKNRTVLVTGHEGFLGSWMVAVLVKNGAKIIGIDIVNPRKISVLNESNLRKKFVGHKGNISNARFVNDIIQQYQPKTIFHIAAEAIVGTANKNPVKTFKSNIEGTWNILEASRKHKCVESIVVASSDKAYGSHKKLPYDESAPLHGDHPYDVSKSCTDLICRSYALTFDVPVCVTRCGNIYGPGDSNFSRIVPDAIRCLLADKPFVIRSDGKFTRDYIYVEDVVNAYLLLAQKMKRLSLAGEAFNFSCEQPLTVLDLYKRIEQACGVSDRKPVILNQAQHEIRHQFLSAMKAKRILHWKANHQIDTGLKKTVLWYGAQNS